MASAIDDSAKHWLHTVVSSKVDVSSHMVPLGIASQDQDTLVQFCMKCLQRYAAEIKMDDVQSMEPFEIFGLGHKFQTMAQALMCTISSEYPGCMPMQFVQQGQQEPQPQSFLER